MDVLVGVAVLVAVTVLVAVAVLDGVAVTVGVEVLVAVDVAVGVGPVVIKRTGPCGSNAGPQGPMTSRRNVLPVFAAPKLKVASIRFGLSRMKVGAFTTFDGFPTSTKRTVVTVDTPFTMKFAPEMIRFCGRRDLPCSA